MYVLFVSVFLFKQKTAYEMRISDWSSDVCSSDLGVRDPGRAPQCRQPAAHARIANGPGRMNDDPCIEETGEGPPLVLLHGWAIHGGVFASLVERLRERYRLYVVDLPGHGRSRARAESLGREACGEGGAARGPSGPGRSWS